MAVKSLTDEQLLLEYRQGCGDRFELLVRRYGHELFHFLYRLLGSSAAAEDIVQETFLQVHLSADRFDVNRKLRPWIFTIAANKARDFLRTSRRRPEVPLDALPDHSADTSFARLLSGRSVMPSLAMETEERSLQVRRLVDQMPLHMKEVLILGYYHSFAYKDMAAILGVPLGTIKSRLHAAVAAFGKLHSSIDREGVEKSID